jgi:hypothetical protein
VQRSYRSGTNEKLSEKECEKTQGMRSPDCRMFGLLCCFVACKELFLLAAAQQSA